MTIDLTFEENLLLCYAIWQKQRDLSGYITSRKRVCEMEHRKPEEDKFYTQALAELRAYEDLDNKLL